jgi:branched-chain amino acid aminotransferase
MNHLWLNGEILTTDTARIDPSDRGFLLGDGLFETMAAWNGAVSALPAHYARLAQGAEFLRIPLGHSCSDVSTACRHLLEANHVESATIRLTLTRGPGPRGLLPPSSPAPTLLLTAAALPPQEQPPLRLITASIRRDENSPLSRIKTLNYLPGVLARIEAAEAGADDALMLNHQGFVAEASAANILVRLGGQWFTPPVAHGALPGIRRAELLKNRVREAPIMPAQLSQAEGIFTSTALALRPVIEIDGHPIPQCPPPN